ncbi:MAG: SM-20-related protein [Marinobacter excellens HL-55]|uniref:SM-20-related protein n=1 Tax=Marinobacter excellens HL-55 TaxID=1305731 RepID=A0A0P7YK30_9GAMM|nr:MAG: SM-20-related protein [Marinobacter excellens HL-55]
MDAQNNDAVIVPLSEPLLERSAGVLNAAVGDALAAGDEPGSLACLVDEQWLDELADGLSEQAWLGVDLTARLPEGLLAALLNEVVILDKTDAMNRAGIGRGANLVKDRSVRRDKIAWLEGCSEPQALLFSFLEQLKAGLNQRLFLGLKRFEAHYATYQSGDFYKRHVDSFRGRASRVISLVLYLNDDWGLEDGGELQVFSSHDECRPVGLVRPESGRAALFLSEEVPHEVLPARRTRYSVACWFRQDEVPLPL